MGKLKLVTVPIGNLDDITLRALKELKRNQYLIAEDTRSLRKLLNFLGIDLSDKKIFSFHDQSSLNKVEQLLRIAEQNDIVLVSEAGSPIISDPAYPVVIKAIENNIEVESFSGITSVVVALELSGLPPKPFHFWGFIPRDNTGVNQLMEQIQCIQGTQICFESPARILKTLKLLCEKFPAQDFAVGRELTKKFQTIYRFKGAEFEQIKDTIVEKGEFVILFTNSHPASGSINYNIEKIANEILAKGVKAKSIAKAGSFKLGRLLSIQEGCGYYRDYNYPMYDESVRWKTLLVVLPTLSLALKKLR